jgi:hypothetical protein
MAFLTEIIGATIDLGIPSPVVTLPSTGVLNAFGTSQSIDSYNVLDDADPLTSIKGDFLAAIVNGSPVAGTYQGGVTFSNVDLGLDIVLTSVALSVNPIEGNYFIGDDGKVYIITDNPLDADNITANVDVTIGFITTSTGPISLTSVISDTIVGDVLDVNGILNQVITTQDPNNDPLVLTNGEINALVCFVAGTLIMTPHGYRKVEDLQVGDLVTTKANGDKPLQWIGSQKVGAATLQANPHLQAIHIKAGALGVGIPSSDLFVSPQHRVLVRSNIAQKMFGTSEVLVAAKQLLQLDGIEVTIDMTEVEYFHILFDQHEVVLSNGAETESLYTGTEALKSVGAAARKEIFTLFPELMTKDYEPQGAQMLVSGRKGRKLVHRHMQNGKYLVA